MTPAKNLGLLLLALCAACGEGSDGDTDFNTVLPGANEAGLPGPVDAALPAPDASTTTPKPDATTSLPPATVDTGVAAPIEAGPAPTLDAGAGNDAAAEAGSGPSTPTTMCAGGAMGMPGSTQNLMLNGRNYTLHIGRSVNPNQPSPLIFSLHGLTMTPASMELMARWDPVADAEGLIIARPAGVGSSNGWDLAGTKDFDLMKAIIEDVNAKSCVDRKRIYATGFSHGGFMSFAIACKLGDIFAAVAPNAGSGSAARGCGQRPVPVYAFHGDGDGVVSYSSGQSAVNSWVSHNKCTGTPTSYTVMNATCQDWNMCSANGQVKFCTIPGLGHTYFRGATAATWEFFKAHPLP
jgi:polyhydroxybutyrate depolymerase